MLGWLKKRELDEIKALKHEIDMLRGRVRGLETEVFCLKGLPAFLFDDPDLLWNAIWRDMDEDNVAGYAVSGSLALRLLKHAGYTP